MLCQAQSKIHSPLSDHKDQWLRGEYLTCYTFQSFRGWNGEQLDIPSGKGLYSASN